MKTTVDIPEADLQAARELTGAESETEAVLKALQAFIQERREREAKVHRLYGSMPKLMSQQDLQAMRTGQKWGSEE